MSVDSQLNEHEDRSLVSKQTLEIVVSILLLASGLVLAWDNWRSGARWEADGPQAGYLPFWLSIILIGAAAIGLAKPLMKRDAYAGSFVTGGELKRVSQMLVPSLLFVAGIGLVGIYIASALFITLFMFVIGKAKWWHSMLVGLIFSAVAFWVFEIQFKVLLPKGPLEAAFGF